MYVCVLALCAVLDIDALAQYGTGHARAKIVEGLIACAGSKMTEGPIDAGPAFFSSRRRVKSSLEGIYRCYSRRLFARDDYERDWYIVAGHSVRLSEDIKIGTNKCIRLLRSNLGLSIQVLLFENEDKTITIRTEVSFHRSAQRKKD